MEIGLNIERESFRIIQAELGETRFNDAELKIVTRVIHATGDFEYAANLRFSANAIADGVSAIRNNCAIIADVRMVQAGVSKRFLPDKDSRTLCMVHDEKVRIFAEEQGITRSAAAIRLQKERLEGAIVAVGNAPTALMEVLRLNEEEGVRPALIIGVPVGFVNAIESKDALAASNLPFIASLGRKGGSSVAAAIINALTALAG